MNSGKRLNENKKKKLGEKRMMNNGMNAVIISYRGTNDIDIQFENGDIRKGVSYDNFKKGGISNLTLDNIISNKIKETKYNNQGLKMWIIEYRGYNDIDIEFEDGFKVYNRTYNDFKNGTVKSKYFPELYGIGYMGDENSKDENGKTFRSYSVWVNMMTRCYNDKYKEVRPTYKDVTMCEEWHNYSNFKKWYDENYYEVEGERTEIEKDILIKGNKLYSPSTCVFIPQTLNSLFTKRNSKRGVLPIGVTKRKGCSKYTATYSINGKNKTLSGFDTPEEAFYAYKKKKEELIKQIADEYKDKIPKKLYDAMYKWEVEIDD